jgi:signal transduction histidine kinase
MKNWDRSPAGHVFLTITALVLLCGSFAAGHGLTKLLFAVTGSPPEVWRHVASGLTGMLLAMTAARAIHMMVYGDHHVWGKRLWTETLDAFDRITRGDFDVFIQPGRYGHFDVLVEKVNKMARELGSMEQLRQEFISNVSHEIQSPLTSISGFASLLRNGALAAERRDHYVDVIETESRRLSSLSDNLLKLSSLESGMDSLPFTEYRLDKQIENAALTLEPQWSKKNLQVEADLDKLSISGDQDLMSQVWINLLNNAVKFTPPCGRLMITLRLKDEEVCCAISDTGAGISPEDQPHIFERFYKSDKARDRSLGGNGLGLSIVKKIVDMHGGSVSSGSEAGKGAAFTVTLPGILTVDKTG